LHLRLLLLLMMLMMLMMMMMLMWLVVASILMRWRRDGSGWGLGPPRQL